MSRPTSGILALVAVLVAGAAGASPPAGGAGARGGSGAETRGPVPEPSTASAARRTVAVSGVTVRGRVRKPGVVVDLSREEARFSQGTAHLSPRDRRFLGGVHARAPTRSSAAPAPVHARALPRAAGALAMPPQGGSPATRRLPPPPSSRRPDPARPGQSASSRPRR